MNGDHLKHFSEGDLGEDIASQAIDIVFPNGDKTRALIRLGKPHLKNGVYRIRAELEGLDATVGQISAAVSFQVLILGIKSLAQRLETFQATKKCQYVWPDTSRSFSILEFFSTIESKISSN